MSTTQMEAGISAILLEQADRLFTQHATRAALAEADRGEWPAQLWSAVEDAGLTLAGVPEESGGVGLPAIDLDLLIRRSAYHTVPIPLAETINANRLWAQAGGEPVQGPVSLAPANGQDKLLLACRAGTAFLSGTADRVPWGQQAGHVLALAHTADGEAFVCLVPGGSAQVMPARNLAYEPRDGLRFENVKINQRSVRPAPDRLDTLMEAGAAMRAQQMAGAMERCLDHALAYVNERVQFGRPLAKFQAIQHMLAIAAGQLAAAVAAADAMSEIADGQGHGIAAAVAKAKIGEAAGQVAAICHQAHGAMGFTREHPLHFATRRLWAWRDEFGSETYWQARIGRLACGLGGEALWPLVTGER